MVCYRRGKSNRSKMKSQPVVGFFSYGFYSNPSGEVAVNAKDISERRNQVVGYRIAELWDD